MQSHYGGIIRTDKEDQHKSRLFWCTVALAQILGVLICLLVGFWTAWYPAVSERHYAKKRYEPNLPFPEYPAFSYHPLFTTLAMVFLLGQGVIIHRICRPYLDPRIRVTIHLVINLAVFCIAVAGIHAIFQANQVHMDNAHTWIGLISLIFLAAQGLLGFLAFYFPGAAPNVHRFYKPIHRFFGVVIFVLACTAALMGVSIVGLERALATDKGDGRILSTALILAITGYAITVVAIVAHPDFTRNGHHEGVSLLSREPKESQPRRQSYYKTVLEWGIKK